MGAKVGSNGQKFRSPWRSFYFHILAVAALFVIIVIQQIKWPFVGYQKWIWYAFLIFFAVVSIDVLRKRFCTVLIVKDEEIAFETGFIGRHSTEIGTADIKTVDVRQSIGQRILNVGDIKIASAGTSGYEIEVQNMPSPYDIRDEIQNAGRNAKRSQNADFKK
ncbi:hypothetical protein AGMMS50276_07810 [Synergistales bacterium]|nr:hypothetical protein AGMMS50276_07810 [Synergistales bacterium]